MSARMDDALAKVDTAHAQLIASAQVLGRVKAFMNDIADLPGVKVEFRCEGVNSTHFVGVSIEIEPVKALAAPVAASVAPETGAQSEAGAAPGANPDDAATPRDRDVVSKPVGGAKTPPAGASGSPAGSKRWTASEDATLIGQKLAGAKPLEIAELLGRDVKSVQNRIFRLRKKGQLDQGQPQNTAPSPSIPNSPKAVSAPPPAVAGDVPPPSSPAPAFGETNDPLRRVRLHLNDCADEGWTDREDLQLIEALSKGCKLDEVAALLRKNPVDVRARFLRLCPEPSVEVQARLIKVLLQRVRGEA